MGEWGHIADQFRKNKVSIMQSFRTEQAYAATQIPQMRFWPEGWIMSFKRSLRQPLIKDLFVQPKTPPENAKMVAFHGTPRPRDLLPGGPLFWDRFPHMGWGTVSWMKDYWLKNGGELRRKT